MYPKRNRSDKALTNVPTFLNCSTNFLRKKLERYICRDCVLDKTEEVGGLDGPDGVGGSDGLDGVDGLDEQDGAGGLDGPEGTGSLYRPNGAGGLNVPDGGGRLNKCEGPEVIGGELELTLRPILKNIFAVNYCYI